jgi:hypothetical protein
MAITRAQQAKQMLQKGGRIGLQGGGKDLGKDATGMGSGKSKGISPGRSQAQFGHTAHAGKTLDQAKSDQRLGIRGTPEGSDPFAGHSSAEEKGFKRQQEINKQIREGTFEPPKKKSFIESLNEKKRKKNLKYIQDLRNKKFKGIMDQYGLTEEQLNRLLEGDDEFTGGRNLTFTGLQQLLDMDPSARNLGENFNEALMQGKLGELALSKRMAKGVPLSTAELFSTTDPTTRIELPGVLSKVQGPETFSNLLSGLNRLETLDTIANLPDGVTQSDIDNYFNLTMGKGGTDPITGDTVDALFTPRDDDGPSQITDPCKGPNPPAYCFIGENVTEETDPTNIFAKAGITPRIAGSLFAADGGLADMDREAFLLGGIAKGLKKAVRGVKKIAKSPLGKAALIGAGFGLAGMGPFKGLAGTSFGKGLAGLRGTLFGQAGSKVGEAFVPYKEGLFTKLGLTKGGGSLIPTFKGGITLASILPLLVGKTDEEKDDILKDYYASQKLEPATTARQAGSEFDFYNYNLAEGGTPRKEPVAKKVMPLLDMDGMEKDYRAEGGFVPIGRMEKADDVPARLSKNEFVFTADAVRNAGDGDVDKGAEVMYNMMKNLEAGGEVSEESQGLNGAREMFQTSKRLGEVI